MTSIFTTARLFIIGHVCFILTHLFTKSRLPARGLDIYVSNSARLVAPPRLLFWAAVSFATIALVYRGFPLIFRREMHRGLGLAHFALSFAGTAVIAVFIVRNWTGAPSLTLAVLIALMGQAFFIINLVWSILRARAYEDRGAGITG